MKTHLENISNILQKFIKDRFNNYYLSINGVVSINSASSLNIECKDEFDDLKVKEIKKIKSDLYETIRKYLEHNKIDKNVYIETVNNSWYSDYINIYFKESIKLNL